MHTLSQDTMMLAQTLGWTILHSLWQGAIIFCSMKLLLKAMGNTHARARYYTTLLSLAGLVVWTIDTFARQWQKLQVVTVTAGHQAYTGSEQVYTTTLPAAAPTETILQRIVPGVEAYFPIIATAYILGIFLMLLRLALGISKVYRLRHSQLVAAPAEWIDHTNRWLKLTGITRPVQIFLSDKVTVPMVAGTLKPFILFPFAAANHLSIRQFEAILLHELAHIKRNDYLLNILQTIAETLLFFNPFIWIISAAIRREREHCCDDLVLSHTTQPIVYAKALAALEANRFFTGRLAMNVTGNNKQQLLHRIKRIVEMKKQPLNVRHLVMSLMAIACIIITAGWLAPSFAQTKNKEQKSKTEKSKITKATKAIPAPVYTSPADADYADAPGAPVPAIPDDIDWDKINDEVARAQKETEKAMADVDWDKIKEELAKAREEMAAVDWNKINAEMAKAQEEMKREMANVDWNKIKADVAKAQEEHKKAMKEHKTAMKAHSKAMDNADWNQVNAEVQAAMKEVNKSLAEVDWTAIGSTVADAMNSINWEDIDQQGTGSSSKKRTTSARANSNLSSANIVVTNPSYGSGKNVQQVNASTSKSEVSSIEYEKMLIKMENEGLIDIDKGYAIKKNGDELTIDGKRQPASVLDRYSKYLQGDRIAVAGGKDNMNISVKD